MSPLLLLVASIALHLEDAGEVPPETSNRIMAELRHQIERVGDPIAVDDPGWTHCMRKPTCIAEIRARTAADAVVVVRLLAGAFSVRLSAELHRGAGAEWRGALDLSEDAAAWGPALAGLSRELFPGRGGALVGSHPVELPPRPSRIVTLVALGAGLTAAGIGFGFGFASRDIGDRLISERHSSDDFLTMKNEMNARAQTANLLYAAAGIAAVAAVVAIWVE